MGSCRSETKAKKALDIIRHENHQNYSIDIWTRCRTIWPRSRVPALALASPPDGSPGGRRSNLVSAREDTERFSSKKNHGSAQRNIQSKAALLCVHLPLGRFTAGAGSAAGGGGSLCSSVLAGRPMK
jgi:hypothetical protein